VAETLFEELKRYVGFTAVDERALTEFYPLAHSHFERFAEQFYERILSHDGARKSLLGGESSIGHLKVTLVQWMERLFKGPWDAAYFELRCRIGRVHVRIALPQHYMFGAMNVIRQQFDEFFEQQAGAGHPQFAVTRIAVGKVLDLDLAIMLHTYREDLLAQRTRQERLATFGQLVGSMGHELRNPLGVMETSLHILKGRIGADERARKHVDRIGEQILVANKIVSDLLDMIRDQPLQRQRLQLNQVMDAVVSGLTIPPKVVLSRVSLDTLPGVVGDAGQLRQLFHNLLENAIYACAQGGEVQITGSHDGQRVSIEVEDTGPGVDEVTRLRLFEPLVTTKEKGIGLGLALVKRISCHWRRFENAPAGG
jgi:signal transduction histidine kinase